MTAMYGLHNLAPSPGSRHAMKRVGRGLNQGGSMCGRGNAGQNSRSGSSPIRGFIGGQTPYWQRARKLGGSSGRHLPFFEEVELERIQHLLLMQRIAPCPQEYLGGAMDIPQTGILTPTQLHKALDSSLHQRFSGYKVSVGETAGLYFDHRLFVIAGAFTPQAIDRIEQLGGIAVAVYHSPATIRRLLRPSPKDMFCIGQYGESGYMDAPLDYRARLFYSNWEERGYLHPKVQVLLKDALPGLLQKYQLVTPLQPISIPRIPTFS